MEKICPFCKEKYFKPKRYGKIRWEQRVYCSVNCQHKAARKKVKVKCGTCKKEFETFRCKYLQNQNCFCNRKCKFQHPHCKDLPLKANNKGRIPWNKGISPSKEVREKISNTLKGKMVGSKNPSWKGGTTPFINKLKRLTEYKTWQRTILERDNFTCRKCFKRGSRLTPHHLTSFAYLVTLNKVKSIKQAKKVKELWEIDNGVTLCVKCHYQTPNYSFKQVNCPIDTHKYKPI